jgi:hypothetical protein
MGDPQYWNLYSYTRNRPMQFVNVGGNWTKQIHADITTAALQGYVSAGELRRLITRRITMDSFTNQSGERAYVHAMRGLWQSTADASSQIWGFVASRLEEATRSHSTAAGLDALGDAVHTIQDYTSPAHTTAAEEPRLWWPMRHRVRVGLFTLV